ARYMHRLAASALTQCVFFLFSTSPGGPWGSEEATGSAREYDEQQPEGRNLLRPDWHDALAAGREPACAESAAAAVVGPRVCGVGRAGDAHSGQDNGRDGVLLSFA